MKTKPFILVLFIFFLSCSKDNNPNVVLNGALTNCPANSTCTYNYYESADFTGPNRLVPGSYRVFAYNSTNQNLCDATIQLYFKTSLSNNNFDISSTQIATGHVMAYNFICACCDYISYPKSIGGEIKGKKIDSNRWLINASIILGSSANNPVDTIVVNQYYTLEKLP